MIVRAKKRLGQHFLNNESVARDIAGSIRTQDAAVLEVGPGMGMLTKFLQQRGFPHFAVIELDEESIAYLGKNFPGLDVIGGDFLKFDIDGFCAGPKVIAGNFPYNISSQILFKALDNRDSVVELVGMFQKEVAERVCAKPGGKQYGILSVLLQAYYDAEYLFTVGEHEFTPPPQVKSAVIRLARNFSKRLDCDERKFRNVVKTAFNYRRKTLRNALNSMDFREGFADERQLLSKRAEQLSIGDFEYLAKNLR